MKTSALLIGCIVGLAVFWQAQANEPVTRELRIDPYLFGLSIGSAGWMR